MVGGDNKESLLQISPIPEYFMLDGFEHLFDAEMVYKRLLACSHKSDMLTHARRFLCTALVGSFHANDIEPFISAADWSMMPPLLANKWWQDRVFTLCPSLFLATPLVTTHQIPGVTPSSMPTDFFTNLF